MTQVHFTLNLEEIQNLIDVEVKDNTAKDILTKVFNQLMEKERDEYLDNKAYQRDPNRMTYRNGYYDRDYTTKLGTLNLKVPRTRDGKFSTEIFERYQRNEKALLLTMLEMYIQGVSTRKASKERELRQEFQQNIQRRTQETLEKTVETEYKKAEERKKNQTEQDTRDHLRGFTRTISAFLMAYGDRETKLNNFELNIDPDTFLEITSITIEDFKKLRDGFKYIDDVGQEREFKGFFDETVFNASIQEFLDKKEELSDYFDEKLSEDIFDYIPNQQTNQIYTPRGVVKLMVDKLEEENPGIFQNKHMKFADLYTKSGLYLTELVKRLNEGLSDQIPNQEERIKWILENQVYGVAPSNIIYNIAKNYVYGIHEDIDTSNLVQWNMATSAQEGTMKEDLIKAYGGEKVKFDVIIGNPPYQEETERNNRANPIYNLFMEESYRLSPKVELITPGRFLFNSGQTPKKWNKKMLSDPHLKIVYYEKNATKIFPTTDIKGGVVVTYRDENVDYGAIELFVENVELQTIIKKIKIESELSLSDIHHNRSSYRMTEKVYHDNPDLISKVKKSERLSIGSNIFEKLPEIFLDNIPEGKTNKDYIPIYGLVNKRRDYKYIHQEYLQNHPNLGSYKVFVAKSNGSGIFGEPLSHLEIGVPRTGHTQTFISFGNFNSELEAINLSKYIRSKFLRTLLGVERATHDNATKDIWKYIPLQDFTSNSDIDWSKSIPEIDQQLYAKYDLSEEEIRFIEENVQPME